MAPHLNLADSNECEYSQRNADQHERQKPGIDLMAIPVFDYRKGHDNQSDQRHKYAPRPTMFECELRRRNEHEMAFRRGAVPFSGTRLYPTFHFSANLHVPALWFWSRHRLLVVCLFVWLFTMFRQHQKGL